MSNDPGKKNQWIYFLGLLFTVVPFILISRYNHPTDDDFCIYQLFYSSSMVDIVKYGYNNFTGRFTLLLLYAQLDPLYSADWLFWTRVWPVVVVIGFLTSVAIFIRTLGGKETSGRESFLLFALMIMIVFQGVPLIASFLFWYTGATVYTVGLAFLLVGLAAFRKAITSTRPAGRVSYIVIATVPTVLAIGSNEIMMSLLVPFLLVTVFLYYRKGQRANLSLAMFLLVVVCAASFVELTAPGNFKRASEMMNISFSPLYFLKAGIKCVYLVGLQSVAWLSQFQIWIAALIAVPMVGKWDLGVFSFKSWPGVILAAFVVFALLVSGALLSCIAYNDLLPRILNVLFVVFYIGLVYLLVLIYRMPQSALFAGRIRELSTKYAVVLFLGAFTLCTFSSKSNVSMAWTDLLFKAREYDERHLQRYAQFEQSRNEGKDSVSVAPLFPRQYEYPRTLFLNDITRDPNGFPNTCIGYFFHLKSLQLNDCPPIESRHLKE